MPIALGSITKTKPRLSPIQLLLLIQLEEAPKYGYEMLKAIKEELNGVWVPKTGTIYPALKSLEKHGLIIKQLENNVDFYHITDDGRDILLLVGIRQAENMKFISRFLATIAKWMSPRLKTRFLTSMVNLPRDHTDVYSILISILDKDVDNDLKINILNNIKTVLEERLAYVNKIIDDERRIIA